MHKRRPYTNRKGEADIPSAPAADCPPEDMSPDVFLVETDLSDDCRVSDTELEAIARLLGNDLARLLD